MHLKKEEINKLERVYRLNLINSITGVKPANLIATRSKNGTDNVAIFSSVVHLGSKPPQIGFIIRQASENPRDTLLNIEETGYYTMNHISQSFMKQAHYTSANLDYKESEFERMKINKEFLGEFHAPFVKDSLVKIGMKHIENILLPNKSTLVIGEIVLLHLPDDVVDEKGQMDLGKYDCVGISGLGSYYRLNKLDSFPHVRPDEIPSFE